MDDINIGWTVASVVTGALLFVGGLFWSDRPTAAWACFAISFLPMVIATLAWSPMANSDIWRIGISGVIGALAGALLLIGAAQALHGRALASDALSATKASENKTTEHVAQNITSNNQSGGITAGTVIIGPQKLVFTSELGNALLAKMTIVKKVTMRSVGGAGDQAIASEVQQFLSEHGFEVQRTAIGVMAPPPDRKIELADSPDGYVLTISPSAN